MHLLSCGVWFCCCDDLVAADLAAVDLVVVDLVVVDLVVVDLVVADLVKASRLALGAAAAQPRLPLQATKRAY
ncbi:MAG: hypothetical protein AAF708_13025 [Deinococcota bacterium]